MYVHQNLSSTINVNLKQFKLILKQKTVREYSALWRSFNITIN